MNGISMLILSVGGIIAVLFFVTYAAQKHDLNGIKDKTVGNGQHGTARWATRQEVKQTYHHVPYTPNQWRQAAKEGKQPTANGKPLPQGIVLGCQGGRKTTALVDSDDVHVLMIGASGVGKTAYFLYPNLEYACASGMSFLALDTKGDLARNYGAIARDIYGYRISVVDLREPTRSDGNNLLTLINRYMDDHREDPTEITAKAKAEKYAKILAKTIISPEGEGSDHGQNAYFYDAAEGLLASVVLLLSEFLPPEETDGYETRHIASVFKLVQELLMQGRRGGNQFQELMQLLPSEHKAKWLAGSALTASDQAMNSIMSTVLSRLNAFLDTELEQVLCFDGGIDAEQFVREKCTIFLILPEEDATKNFVASLMIQNLARELFSVANEHGGKLPNRAVFFMDEFGTIPRIESAEMMFSAGRSRRITMVPIIQSIAQLEKNYGKEGAEIIVDNTQVTLFGGFAPNSGTAEAMSKALGSRTVMSGYISKGKSDPSQTIQMMERPLMTPDELKSIPKGHFIVMKTGTHPMRTRLRLFLEWGITFGDPYSIPEKTARPVAYASKQELELAMQDGVEFLELAAPVKQENGVLTCEKMRLGEPDASGRRSPVPTGETVELPCDLVISAVGEQVEEQVFTDNGITLSAKGRPAFCTNVPGVYAAGDALRGPATVVEGIADAARFAEAVIGAPHTYDIPAEAHPTEAEVIARKGILRAPGKVCCEGERCLSCDTVCQNCVDVCPNRANVAVRLPDGRTEIVHVDKMCNECGNCTAFCPYASEPCKDKLTLFQTTEDMDDSKNFGFCFLPDGKVRARLTTETVGDPDELPADAALLVRTIRDSYSYLYR